MQHRSTEKFINKYMTSLHCETSFVHCKLAFLCPNESNIDQKKNQSSDKHRKKKIRRHSKDKLLSYGTNSHAIKAIFLFLLCRRCVFCEPHQSTTPMPVAISIPSAPDMSHNEKRGWMCGPGPAHSLCMQTSS